MSYEFQRKTGLLEAWLLNFEFQRRVVEGSTREIEYLLAHVIDSLDKGEEVLELLISAQIPIVELDAGLIK
jgi:hypothetical protein